MAKVPDMIPVTDRRQGGWPLVSVRVTPAGRAQLLAAVAYLRREAPGAAARFRQRAEAA